MSGKGTGGRGSELKTADAEEEYKRARRLHDDEVKAWRLFEATLTAKATANPSSVLLLTYDDTVSMGFPHLGRRGIKNITKHRHEMREAEEGELEDEGKMEDDENAQG